MMNVMNGGAHADNPVDFQEFMIMPVGAASFAQALQMGAEIYQRLKASCARAASPRASATRAASRPALRVQRGAARAADVAAIEAAGYRPGDEVAIALDPASSEFFVDGAYRLAGEGRTLSSTEMVDYWEALARALPDRVARGRHGRGGLGRLGGADRAHRRAASSSSATTSS